MNSLQYRSNKLELLDGDNIPFEDIKQNMKELNTINTLLGGHNITLQGFKSLIGNRQSIVVCEIGCGGGDNIAVVHSYCKKNNIPATFVGVDIKQTCIDFARTQYPEIPCQWMTSDYELIDFSVQPDIIFSSLLCHHFREPQLISMLQWMQHNSKVGFFINDLERNYLAYQSIKLLTKFFSSSYLVKNDAPLSVARGFKKREWLSILKKSAIGTATVSSKWAFRHLILFKH